MRIAITGTGCVSPIGASAAELLDGLDAGAIGVRSAPWSDGSPGSALFAAVHEEFDPRTVLDDRVIEGTDAFVAFGVAACEEALAEAGLATDDRTKLDPLRTAVVDGTSMGGFYSLMHAQWAFDRHGPERIPPKTMLRIWSNMTAAQLCIRHGLHGPSLTVTTACASALDAVGQAAGLITSGTVDVALCGGTEGGAPSGRPGTDGFVPVTSVAGRTLGMESPSPDPLRAVLPFDPNRSGIVFGEGSAWFVLESEEHATARGALPLAWLRGYGSCADAHHPSSPEPSGRWEARAMELALARAGTSAADVDIIIAHATGTPKGDLAEIRAINGVFVDGADRPDLLVTSIKGHTAHTGASSGGMGMVAAIGALRRGRLTYVAGTTEVDPEVRFDVPLQRPREVDASVAQVNAFGFGGQDASVVLTRDPQ